MIIINGNNIENNALINLDEGYMFGRGVFETILVKEGPLFIKEHINRLNKGISTLKIKNNVEEKFVLNTIEDYNINNCVLKVVVTDNNVVFTTRPNPYAAKTIEDGLKVKVSKIKRNPFSHFTYIKSLNYIDNMLEREAAQDEGFQEVIFLNIDDKLAEGSASNIFFIKDEVIYTPSVDCGILDGIIRGWIINNFNVVEGNFTLQDILESDGAFLTNSLMGIIKIHSIDDSILNYSNMTNEIRRKYELALKNNY